MALLNECPTNEPVTRATGDEARHSSGRGVASKNGERRVVSMDETHTELSFDDDSKWAPFAES